MVIMILLSRVYTSFTSRRHAPFPSTKSATARRVADAVPADVYHIVTVRFLGLML